MDCPDEHMVKQVLAGDRKAYDRLVLKYQAALCGLAYQWTQNVTDAQDLTQEAFLQAYQKLDQLREPARLAGWLRGIATNLCRMWRRRQERTPEFVDALDVEEAVDGGRSPALQPHEALQAEERRRAVVDVLDLLSDKVGLTARLFYVDGLTYQEIRDVLDVPTSTIESRLHKARQQLKREVLGSQADANRRRRVTRLHLIAKEAFRMDAIRMEIGLDLIPFVHREDPDNILTYIRRMRRDLASEFDITVPAVRVRDNIYLAARGYMIFLQEERVTEGSLQDREGATILADRLRQTILDHRGKLGN